MSDTIFLAQVNVPPRAPEKPVAPALMAEDGRPPHPRPEVPRNAQGPADLFMGAIILFGILLIAIAIVIYWRHRYLDQTDGSSPDGFTLADLRNMRDRGELTPNEYEVAKNKLIADFKRSQEAKERLRELRRSGDKQNDPNSR